MSLQRRFGPPQSPLPVRWWLGLTRRQRARVIHIERLGCPCICPRVHYKGYPRVYIGRGHPYANQGGTTELHRWLVARGLGRKLATWEHVHHKRHGHSHKGVDKISTEDLELLEAVEHGQYHYGRHFIRDPRTRRFVWISCGEEVTEGELLEREQGE